VNDRRNGVNLQKVYDAMKWEKVLFERIVFEILY